MLQTSAKSLTSAAIAAIALCLTANVQSAQAATVSYTFELTAREYFSGCFVVGPFPCPPLQPFEFGDGNFSYDDSVLTGIGLESLSPNQGDLKLLLNFDGNVFTEKSIYDPLNLPEQPQGFTRIQANFQDGQLLELSLFLFATPNTSTRDLNLVAGEFTSKSLPDPRGISFVRGTVSYTPPIAIPEPISTIGAVVAVGLGAWGRRRLAKKSQI
jgi:hypothetical protein